MKHKVMNITMAVMAALSFASCEVEPLVPPVLECSAVSPAAELRYTLDGVEGRLPLADAADGQVALGLLFAQVEAGHTLTLLPTGDAPQSGDHHSDPIVFTTTDAREALVWSDSMRGRGYAVTISYDTDTRTYICTAEEPDHTGNGEDETEQEPPAGGMPS